MQKKIFVLILGIISFFLFDTFFIFTSGHYWLHSLLCLSVLLFAFQSYLLFSISLIGIGFESFLAYDLFGLTYLYIIPVFCLFFLLSPYFVSKKIGSFFLFITALLCHQLLLFLFKLNYDQGVTCTLLQISGNMIVLYFSLKWLPIVEQGNRF